jgi:hypothetical protein
MTLVSRIIEYRFPGRVTRHPARERILTRLNHFNLRLRPIGLRPSYLIFGVTYRLPDAYYPVG